MMPLSRDNFRTGFRSQGASWRSYLRWPGFSTEACFPALDAHAARRLTPIKHVWNIDGILETGQYGLEHQAP